jgi:DNA-binding GntR family transcriptional regulator
MSAYQRLFRVLKLIKPDPVRQGSWLIYPLPTQAQIAAQASTTRETVARVLSHLSADGVAERKSKTLYVRQVERLRQLCDKVVPMAAKDGVD